MDIYKVGGNGCENDEEGEECEEDESDDEDGDEGEAKDKVRGRGSAVRGSAMTEGQGGGRP